jgi:guanylate kinase
MQERGEFLECAEVHGHMYGTPERAVREKLDEGIDVILEIDVKGARQVRSREPEAVSIFVEPPSEEVLEHRLRGRATEPEDELRRRLEDALEEKREKNDFDYEILNDDLERAARELYEVYEKESRRNRQNRVTGG